MAIPAAVEPDPVVTVGRCLTVELVKAGQLLDIECLDHIVIGKGRYVSLEERGLGF
jgi:DNA repair protein RadC